MKRLQFVYRGVSQEGKTLTARISVPEPIDNIANISQQELTNDINTLKTLGVVPSEFEPDEVRVTESNATLYLNLIE